MPETYWFWRYIPVAAIPSRPNLYPSVWMWRTRSSCSSGGRRMFRLCREMEDMVNTQARRSSSLRKREWNFGYQCGTNYMKRRIEVAINCFCKVVVWWLQVSCSLRWHFTASSFLQACLSSGCAVIHNLFWFNGQFVWSRTEVVGFGAGRIRPSGREIIAGFYTYEFSWSEGLFGGFEPNCLSPTILSRPLRRACILIWKMTAL